VKPFFAVVKVPMFAIVFILSMFRAAPIAASMAVRRPGAIGAHPKGDEMKWRTAGRHFLGSRGIRMKFEGEESFEAPLRQAERGEAVFRSDMPQSRPH
jgi:hypothetical protein